MIKGLVKGHRTRASSVQRNGKHYKVVLSMICPLILKSQIWSFESSPRDDLACLALILIRFIVINLVSIRDTLFVILPASFLPSSSFYLSFRIFSTVLYRLTLTRKSRRYGKVSATELDRKSAVRCGQRSKLCAKGPTRERRQYPRSTGETYPSGKFRANETFSIGNEG